MPFAWSSFLNKPDCYTYMHEVTEVSFENFQWKKYLNLCKSTKFRVLTMKKPVKDDKRYRIFFQNQTSGHHD